MLNATTSSFRWRPKGHWQGERLEVPLVSCIAIENDAAFVIATPANLSCQTICLDNLSQMFDKSLRQMWLLGQIVCRFDWKICNSGIVSTEQISLDVSFRVQIICTTPDEFGRVTVGSPESGVRMYADLCYLIFEEPAVGGLKGKHQVLTPGFTMFKSPLV